MVLVGLVLSATRQLLALALLVALLSGYVGFAGTFSDRTGGETLLHRSFLVLATQALGGTLFGFLLPRHWYLSVLAAWGSTFFVIIGVIGRIAHRAEARPEVNPADLIHPVWVLFAAPLLAISLGRLAARMLRAIFPTSVEPSG